MTTYSISVDDVDLALLPLRSYTHNNFLKKEYFHFKVMEETTPEPPSIETYTCHICAIKVPSAFALEHATSAKHSASARIASAAALRMREYITAPPPPPAGRSTARFCANCSAVVDEDHDKTKEHRVAVMHDNLLCELMKTYVGDDELKGDDKRDEDNKTKGYKKDEVGINGYGSSNNAVVDDVNDTNNTPQNYVKDDNKIGGYNVNNNGNDGVEIKKEENKEIDKNSSNITTDRNQSTNLTLQPTTSRWIKLPIKDVRDIESNQREQENTVANSTEIRKKTKNTKADYGKELRKFIDSNNSFELKEIYNRIQIKRDYDTISVYYDHFHSYHRKYNREIECIICNCTFSNKEAETHKYDSSHMTGVVNIGEDGHCIRKINDSHSHCILCNQKINNINVEHHKQSHHHLVRKTNNVKINTNQTKSDTNTNVGIDNIQGATNGNAVKTDEHNTNRNADKDNISIGSSIEYPYEKASGQLQCVVCNCRVPSDLNNRKEHVKGARHVYNMKHLK